MAEAHDRNAWAHTSSLLALIANVNRDPRKSRALRPDDFNPYARRRRRGIPVRTDNIKILKALLPSGQRNAKKRS